MELKRLPLINTVPEATFDILNQKGIVIPGSIETHIDRAVRHILKLQDLDIDLEKIAVNLRDDGVKAFADACDKALRYIESVISSHQGG